MGLIGKIVAKAALKTAGKAAMYGAGAPDSPLQINGALGASK